MKEKRRADVDCLAGVAQRAETTIRNIEILQAVHAWHGSDPGKVMFAHRLSIRSESRGENESPIEVF